VRGLAPVTAGVPVPLLPRHPDRAPAGRVAVRPLAAFDRAVAGLVHPYATDGVLDLPVAADVTWGRITVTARS